MSVNGTLVERVATELRAAILAGELEPGARIGQSALAKQFGTSRLPVREALRLLQKEGLISLRPNAGARVANLSLSELTEIYLLREHLEPLALSESIPLLSAEQVEGLRECVQEMERAAADADRWHWLETDRDFHLGTFAAVPLPRVLALVESFWAVAGRYRRVAASLLFPSQIDVQHSEHRLLLDAIERRDPADAAALLAIHIRRTRLVLSEHQELFDDPAR